MKNYDVQKIKNQLEKELGEEVSNVSVECGWSVDFNLGNVRMWARLTKTGNIKKHSIRLNTN